MLLLLKIPVVYLCAVIYWAIRQTPEPLEPARVPAQLEEGPYDGRRGPHRCQARPRPRRPSSSPRVASRPRRATLARR